MPIVTDPVGYWDHYAEGVANETPEEALKNAFGWTQYAGHGPARNCSANPSPRWSWAVAAVTRSQRLR